jgi:NADH:ubiquinone oxidoreductase subunit H
MLYNVYQNIISPFMEVIIVLVPTLLSVAYVTVAERKTMGSMQRRLGPNAVGLLVVNLNFPFKRLFYISRYNYNIL